MASKKARMGRFARSILRQVVGLSGAAAMGCRLLTHSESSA